MRRGEVLSAKAASGVVVFFLLLVILLPSLSGCGSMQAKTKADSEAGSEPPAISVEVVPARRGDLVVRVPVPGVVTAGAQVDLAFKAGGKIADVAVKPGDRVEKGQVLARLEQSDILAQVAQAEAAVEAATANLARAEKGPRPEEIDQLKAHVEAARAASDAALRNLERMKSLYEAGAIPKAQYEGAEVQAESARQQLVAAEKQLELALKGSPEEIVAAAKAQVKQAQAAASLARSQLQGSSITAPFAGEISSVNAEEGELVSPGMPILTLVDPSGLCVSAVASESLSKYLEQGKEVFIRTKTSSTSDGATAIKAVRSGGGSPEDLMAAGYLPAVLTEVSPSADPGTKGFLIKAAVGARHKSDSGSTVSGAVGDSNAPSELKPGVFAEILLPTEETRNAVIIPRKAVLSVDSFDEDAQNQARRWVAFVVKKADEGSGNTNEERWVAEERVVEPGVATADLIEVVSGIREGELVVVTGQHFLENGCRVVIAGDGRVGGAD
ncbi:MAG TPA: biotin/lipoyl-binding protein [Clostridia bacterium]|nr:biotin/lipoyl-binding protein [Clostridia bacterium]